MKLNIAIILSSLFVSSAFADECTGRVDAYISGLEVGIVSTAANSAQAKEQRKQIDYIQNLREVKTDCQVTQFIPALVKSEKAIDAAVEAVQKR